MRESSGFFKELPRYRRKSVRDEAEVAKATVYYWWWRFALLDPVAWVQAHTKTNPRHPARAYGLGAHRSGSRTHDAFQRWWSSEGRYLFAEDQLPAKVLALDVSRIESYAFDTDKLYLEIPLTKRRKTIMSEINKILANVHEGRAFDLAKTSTAKLRIYTKRYRLRSLERNYWVLLYKLLYPKMPLWRIADRLQLSPALKVRGTETDSDAWQLGTSSVAKLNAMAGRYLYQGRFLLQNLQLGDFPKVKQDPRYETFRPFGTAAHDWYLSKLDSEGRRRWLHMNHHRELMTYVLEQNKKTYLLERIKQLRSKHESHLDPERTLLRVRRFLAGESDDI